MPRLRSSSCQARFVWLFIGAIVLVAPAVRADPRLEPVRLVYRAPEGCPSVDDFLAEVRRSAPRMRLAGPDEPARVFAVAIGEDGRDGGLTIETEGAAGQRLARGANCTEVIKLLAFATALAVDPDATLPPGDGALVSPQLQRTQPADESSRPHVTHSAVIPASSRNETSASMLSAKTRWSLGGYAFAEGASAPSVSFGGGAFGDIGRRMGRWSPALRFGIGYGTSTPASADNASVTFATVLGLLEACPTVWGLGRVSVRPCLRAEGGLRTTAGHDIVGARSVRRPWFAVGATTHFRGLLGGPVFVDLGVGLLFPTVRDRVFLAPETTVHVVPWVGGLGELALGVEFGDQDAK